MIAQPFQCRSFAIVPAAGASRRMGAPKLLLPWRGRAIIEHVLAAWEQSPVTRAVVVTRPGDHQLAERCRQFNVDVVTPRHAPRDMKSAVGAGLRHVAAEYRPWPTDAWLLAPADMPRLPVDVIRAVLDAYDPASPRIVCPTHHGRGGHPVLFPWDSAERVRDLPADAGVNALVHAGPVCRVPCGDGAIREDIDTPHDYQRLWSSATATSKI